MAIDSMSPDRPPKSRVSASSRVSGKAANVPQAPVAFFVYNRPAQVERVLESLRRNTVSKLYIFSDGPKRPADANGVDEVRKLVRSIRWISPEVVERPVNHGIRESMLLGLELVFDREDRVIVIEDDISVAPEFCAFMNTCLDRYRDEDAIAGVTGLRYPFDRSVFDDYPYDVFLSPRFSSWAWGTWKHWWERVSFDQAKAIVDLSTTSDAELRVAGPDAPEMIRYLADGDPLWGATTADVFSLFHMIKNHQFFICPTWNMVENLGFYDGTHASASPQSWSLEWEAKNDFAAETLRLPDDLRPTTSVWETFDSFLGSIQVAPSVSSRSRSASEIARLVIKDVTPPIVLRARRALRAASFKSSSRSELRRLTRSHEPRRPEVPSNPNPSEYTTTDGPTEVPLQKETYYTALNEYVEDGDRVLDVGCGIGYGLNLLSIKAGEVVGVDVDAKAIDYCTTQVLKKNPKLKELRHYDGYHLPYEDRAFDVVTCIDVIEHVEHYDAFIDELLRVARRRVVFGTPNRRAEFTNPDGTPKNFWHLREWSYKELDEILRRHASQIDWYFVNGAWEGPFTISRTLTDSTQSLVAVLIPEPHE
jgi:2-polyprenyl-3-methyl-5-hydroxy-6-metoxy-1,4-benzoquinol methylase